MKIIFAGTPDFSVPTLQALINSKHDVVAVYTQPDRPKGRGRHLGASPVKELALKHSIPVEQPLSLKKADAQATLKKYNADLMVVVAYGLILPKVVLDTPKFGCINVHASLLPRWRGASPIQSAILAGDNITGITIMQMDQGLDSGDMLLKVSCPIEPNDTAQTLHDRLSGMGAAALLNIVAQVQAENLSPGKQHEDEVTFAPKIKKADAEIDWHKSAIEIERQVRGFNPWPIAFANINGEVMRVWQAKAIDVAATKNPGEIESTRDKQFLIATGEGLLKIEKLQLAGGKPISAEDYLNAHHFGS